MKKGAAMFIQEASWIRMRQKPSTVVPVFRKTFPCTHPDPRVNSLCAVLDTVHGRIRSAWKYMDDGIRYEIETPVETEIILDGKTRIVGKGSYLF